jgi:hypothetical protein
MEYRFGGTKGGLLIRNVDCDVELAQFILPALTEQPCDAHKEMKFAGIASFGVPERRAVMVEKLGIW